MLNRKALERRPGLEPEYASHCALYAAPHEAPVFPGCQRLFLMDCLLTKTPERALYRVSTCGGLIPVSVPRSPKQGALLAMMAGLEPTSRRRGMHPARHSPLAYIIVYARLAGLSGVFPTMSPQGVISFIDRGDETTETRLPLAQTGGVEPPLHLVSTSHGATRTRYLLTLPCRVAVPQRLHDTGTSGECRCYSICRACTTYAHEADLEASLVRHGGIEPTLPGGDNGKSPGLLHTSMPHVARLSGLPMPLFRLRGRIKANSYVIPWSGTPELNRHA